MAKTSNTAKVTFKKDANGDWRWQIKKGRNITAASTEGYKNRIDCRGNFIQTYLDMKNFIEYAVLSHVQKLKLDFIEDFKRLK